MELVERTLNLLQIERKSEVEESLNNKSLMNCFQDLLLLFYIYNNF